MKFVSMSAAAASLACLGALLLLNGCGTLLGDNTPPELFTRFKPHTLSVTSISWSPDGKLLASASQDTSVKVWDVTTWQLISQRDDFQGTVTDVSWSPDSRLLAIASAEPRNALRLWEYNRDRTTMLTDPGRYNDITSLSWSPDGQRLAVGLANSDNTGRRLDGAIDIYDARTGAITQVLTVTEPIYVAAWSPNGEYIAAGYDRPLRFTASPNVRIWNMATDQVTISYEHSEAIYALAWSPESDLLASGAIDGSIKLWDISAGRSIADLKGHSSSVETLAWSPKGAYLASGSTDYTLKLWEITGGSNVVTFTNPDYVNSLAFSPDGNFVAAGCQNGEILVWSVP